MKTEERLMKVYIAEDGTEFLKEYQCENYEKELHKETQRYDFLNKIILEEMKITPGLIPYWVRIIYILNVMLIGPKWVISSQITIV